MANEAAKSSSRPLPLLPLELKHHILRFCSPATLATTSRVSFAFLELSSPILYQDIEIVGLQNVEKLFCSRLPPLDHSHLDPHLSLLNIRNVTIIATPDVGGDPLDLSPSRLPPCFPSLVVDLLTLRPIATNTGIEEEENRRWGSLFVFFDPKAVHVFGLENEDGLLPRSNLAPSSTTRWPHLTHLHLANVDHVGYVTDAVESLEPSVLLLLLDISFPCGDQEYDEDLVQSATYELGSPGHRSEKVKEYAVGLGGRIDKKALTDCLESIWGLNGAKEVEDWFERVRFEDATSTCCWKHEGVSSSST